MKINTVIISILILCILVVLFIGMKNAEIDNSLGNNKFATISWANIDDMKDTYKNIVHIFNNEEIGKGIEGFQKLVNKINELPKETTVVVYPDLTDELFRDPSSPPTIIYPTFYFADGEELGI